MTAQRLPAERRKTARIETPAPSAVAQDRPPPMPRQDARMLQARASAFAAGQTLDHASGQAKWSSRRTLGFIVIASLALWGGVLMTAWLLVRSF